MKTLEELSLLEAIGNEPDEDLHRLALADYLEEQSEYGRADIIRRGVAKPKRFTFRRGWPA